MAVKRANDVVFEQVEGRAVLLHPSGKELLTLNPVGTMVWEQLASSGEASTIAQALLPRFNDVTQPQLEADVAAFLAELGELGLVVPADPS